MTAATYNASQRVNLFADKHFKWLVLAPAIIVLLFIGLYPLIHTGIVSFQQITMMEEDTSWAGFDNYGDLFSDGRLWASIGHTFLILAIALPVELVLGLLMAQLFLEKMPFKQVFVALLIIPTVISPIVAGATWRLMFDNQYGPVNQIISWFAGEPQVILWVTRPEWVYPAILICEVWQWTPFMFLILLAALSNVDRSLVEAAEIDGASFWKIFFKITLPVIRPVLIIAILIRALDLFRIFDIIWAMTKGGPGSVSETISIYTYIRAFKEFDTSYSGAIAFLVIILLSVIVVFALKRVRIVQ
jgi:multiple sugar transport system permease protein